MENTNRIIFAKDDFVVDARKINMFWDSGTEEVWRKALAHYSASLKPKSRYIEDYIGNIRSEDISNLSVQEFYDFLHDKYFVWVYTSPNRLKTTRMSLEKYITENCLSELADIQKRLFNNSHEDIKASLKIAQEIKGLGIAGASGLLAVLFPDKFGTVNQQSIDLLKNIESLSHEKANLESGSKQGIAVIRILRKQAEFLNKKFGTDEWTPRKVDMVLWAFDKEQRN